jgi:UDP-glucuronate 4-epimerase
MALFTFTKAILEGQQIDVYRHGDMKCDFTCIDDLVEGILLLIDAVPERPANFVVPEGYSLSPVTPWRVVNIGTSKSAQLTDFLEAIETAVGMSAATNLLEIQPEDVPANWAKADLLHRLTGYQPET